MFGENRSFAVKNIDIVTNNDYNYNIYIWGYMSGEKHISKAASCHKKAGEAGE